MTLQPRKVSADQRLATYGTLAPGEINHHMLVDLEGRWLDGVVYGRRHASGWGAALGFPGLELDVNGDAVAVRVLESPDLPARWSKLDEFEGPGYERVIATVFTADGAIEASIYSLSDNGRGA